MIAVDCAVDDNQENGRYKYLQIIAKKLKTKTRRKLKINPNNRVTK